MKCHVFLLLNLAVASTSCFNLIELEDIDKEIDFLETRMDVFQHRAVKPHRSKRSTLAAEDVRWPLPVPYTFHDGLALNAKGVILKAFDEFRLRSCIDFKPRVSEKYFISFEKLSGCFSDVGKQEVLGQALSIGQDCDRVFTVEHEVLHALGFFHEHSRYDRDKYVTIVFKNIKRGFEKDFNNVSKEISTNNNVSYDYWSVLHYSQDAFSNGNGSTIITKDPKFQNVIGQKLGMSPGDALELNRYYKCNSTVAFQMYCGFSKGDTCQMSRCSQSHNGWELVTRVSGGPNSDHTSLPCGSQESVDEEGYFMHASTAVGQEGSSLRLETQRMYPKRRCNVQCLQFYYYHSGSNTDELNIWIREFEDSQDARGSLCLMAQITGPRTSHWRLHHVPLNATKPFQVVFDVRKGAGSSTGGFSIDDINVSELECPHVTVQIDEFEARLNSSQSPTVIYSPRQYSREGYAYRAGILLNQTTVGLYVQPLSGDYDRQLEWPYVEKQILYKMSDQSPDIQVQMSKQKSVTTTASQTASSGRASFSWTNPHEGGSAVVDEKEGLLLAGPLTGFTTFSSLEEMKLRAFLKGGSAVFMFSIQDLAPLVNGSTLPCLQIRAVKVTHSPTYPDEDSCGSKSPENVSHDKATDSSSVFSFAPGMLASSFVTVLAVLKVFIL